MDGRTLEVHGASWMDHEFFSRAMAPNLAGWDWFSLQLADGWEVMLYLLRHQDGSVDPASSGTLMDPREDAAPEPGRFYGQAHRRLDLPPHPGQIPGGLGDQPPRGRLPLTLTPTLPDQEIRAQAPAKVTYWEGQVKIEGVKNGAPVTGLGYAELTGYAGALGGRF